MRVQNGGQATVEIAWGGPDEFPALLTGEAEAALTGSLQLPDEIYGLDVFAVDAAVVSSGEQLGR